MLKRFLFPTTDKMPTSAQTAAVVKRLEAADVAERATLADLESDYGVRLVLAEEPGAKPPDIAAAQKSEQRVIQQRGVVAAGEVKLAAARQRHQQVLEAEAGGALTAKWEQVERLKEECAPVAAEIQRLIEALAPQVLKLATLRDQIKAACPLNLGRFEATMTTGGTTCGRAHADADCWLVPAP